MALTITENSTGYFEFAPDHGHVRGDLNPKVKLNNGKLDFLYSDNQPMYPGISYTDIIIIDAEAQDFDTWANANEVMSKLKELGMG